MPSSSLTLLALLAGLSCVPYGNVCLRNSDCRYGEVCASSGACVTEAVPSDADTESSAPAPASDAQSDSTAADVAADVASPRDATVTDSADRDASDSGRTDSGRADAGRTDGATDARTVSDASRSGG